MWIPSPRTARVGPPAHRAAALPASPALRNWGDPGLIAPGCRTLWYSCEPCEKLKRATFMPARSSSSMTSTLRDAGPSVQTTWRHRRSRRQTGGAASGGMRSAQRAALAAQRQSRTPPRHPHLGLAHRAGRASQHRVQAERNHAARSGGVAAAAAAAFTRMHWFTGLQSETGAPCHRTMRPADMQTKRLPAATRQQTQSQRADQRSTLHVTLPTAPCTRPPGRAAARRRR